MWATPFTFHSCLRASGARVFKLRAFIPSGMRLLAEGDLAPSFTLPADSGRRVSLEALRGRKVVVWFYAEAGTPACALQGKDFRDASRDFESSGVLVVGISPDPVEALRAFRRESRIPFPLLSDPDHAVATAYGAWGKKSLYGRNVVGTIRSTFLVGPDGRILRAFRNVRAKGHCARVLAELPRAGEPPPQRALKRGGGPAPKPRSNGRGRAR